MPDNQDWIDDLYAEGRDDGPPAVLDEAILAAARDNATRPWYRDPRRLATVATAASFVLAAMIVYYGPLPEDAEPDATTLLTDLPENAFKAERDLATQPEALETTVEETAVLVRERLDPSPAAPAAGRSAPAREARLADAEAAPSPAAMLRAPAEAPAARRLTDPAEVMAELEGRCGSLPGSPETRRLGADEEGWYLIVAEAEETRYWRCEGERWVEIEAPASPLPFSEQQQPDPQDDQ